MLDIPKTADTPTEPRVRTFDRLIEFNGAYRALFVELSKAYPYPEPLAEIFRRAKKGDNIVISHTRTEIVFAEPVPVSPSTFAEIGRELAVAFLKLTRPSRRRDNDLPRPTHR